MVSLNCVMFLRKLGEYKRINQDEIVLDMHGLQEGVYILEITSSDKTIYKKVILTVQE